VRAPASLLLCSLLCAPAARAQRDEACAQVDCSGHGTCFEENGAAHCLCDPGFSEVARACVPDDGEDAALRARHGEDVAGRILDVAIAELGHRRPEVGAGRTGDPGRLADHLAPHEWWCGDFVSWVYASAGVGFSGGSSGGWHIPDNRAIAAWFDVRGLWYDRSHPEWETTAPQAGDFVRIRTARYGHAAIVREVVGDTVHTIEGNVIHDGERTSRVEHGTYYHFHRNPLIDGFGRVDLGNAPPSVEAGDDREIVLGESLVLHGEVTDDGPLDELVVRWSGPPDVRFEAPGEAVGEVWFTAPGEHVLTVTAHDASGIAVADELTVRVAEPPPPPPEPEPELAPPAAPTTWGCTISGSGPGPGVGGLLVALLAFFARRR